MVFRKKNVYLNSAFMFLVFFMLQGSPPEAYGHPHATVSAHMEMNFDAKGFSGMEMNWSFDKRFSRIITEKHDINSNGKLEPEESKQVIKKEFSRLKKYGYFTNIRIEGKHFQVKFIKNFSTTLENGIISCRFQIPCHVLAISTPKHINVAMYDPTGFFQINFDTEIPVTFEGNSPFLVQGTIHKNKKISYMFGSRHPWEFKMTFQKS